MNALHLTIPLDWHRAYLLRDGTIFTHGTQLRWAEKSRAESRPTPLELAAIQGLVAYVTAAPFRNVVSFESQFRKRASELSSSLNQDSRN